METFKWLQLFLVGDPQLFIFFVLFYHYHTQKGGGMEKTIDRLFKLS